MRSFSKARIAGGAGAVVTAIGVLVSAVGVVPAVAEEAPADRVVLSEDFSGSALPEGWTSVGGDWRVENGRLVGSATAGQARLTFGEHQKNYRFEATVRFESIANSARWQALGLDMPADGSVPWQHAAMRSGTTSSNGIEFARKTAQNTWNVTDAAAGPTDAGVGTDVRVAIEVYGNTGRWYFNDQLVLETKQLARTADGIFGLVVDGATVSYDDIVITELDPLPPIEMVAPGDTGIVIAHRGNSSLAPENTMPAFVSAARSGADYIEIDIYPTADGVPVVIHDGTVDRTTDGSGSVTAMTLEQLRTLDAGSWFAESFTGTRIPTLEEVLAFAQTSGSKILVEYKGLWSPEHSKTTTDLIAQYGVGEQIFAQSFDINTLVNVGAADPALPLGYLVGDFPADAVAVAEQYSLDAINPGAGAVLAHPETLNALNEAGYGVFPYTIDDAATWASLTALGVEGIITNRPDRLAGWNSSYNNGGRPGEEVPEAGENEQLIGVDVATDAVTPSGEFTWRFSSGGAVSLGEAAVLGDALYAQGAINPILVTDTRRYPASTWQLAAQVSDFVAGDKAISAANLGWSPRVDVAGAGAVAGPAVASGFGGIGAGLSELAVLGESANDEYKGVESAQLGAALDLRIPLDQNSGSYSSTLTITAVQ
ncbi:hypothetical protein GCM10022381_26760 [Leifsonia kafniensis]|uniref:GP-PDE domain-containing protein n=1 Tax=Leifsonia kafniensis TaxID=475957 RepID=A0ABP7KMZ9_9MICO